MKGKNEKVDFISSVYFEYNNEFQIFEKSNDIDIFTDKVFTIFIEGSKK